MGHNTANPNTVNLAEYNAAKWLGAFHNHTSGETIKMFSPDDLLWFISKALIKTSHQPPSVTSVGISELFLGLVNVNEVYCIKIKDWNKFYNLKNVAVFKELETKLVYNYTKSGANASQVQLQKDFLKILKELDLGIGLYQQDENNKWSEINLNSTNNNTDPVKTPCS